MNSDIKKLVCVYTHVADVENANKLIKHIENTIDLIKCNVTIIRVIAGSDRHKFVKDTLFLKCKESYDTLSIKTYNMIRMCYVHRNFDYLIKIDSSIVNYDEKKNVGYSKKVRSFYYDLNRISFLLSNDFKFRLNKDYGGLHITPSGDKEGYIEWAKKKNIAIEYDKVFGENDPPRKYTGKCYYISKQLCGIIINKGYSIAKLHAESLGGSEDTLIPSVYSKYISPNWQDEQSHNIELVKFQNFRNDKNTGRFKSLYVVDETKKLVWYVNPKVASRTISKYLNLKFPEVYSEKRDDEVVETHEYLPTSKYYDYFKFIFVRNPYDRLLSVFLDKTKKVIGTQWELPFFAQFKDYTFEQFVKHLYEHINLNHNETNRHIRTQMSLANDGNDLNFIGRFENLKNDLNVLGKTLHRTHFKTPENKNKTEHDHYSNHYTNTMKKMVYEMYFEDFVKFNYENEL
jgi:hypothetical protein